MAVGYQEGQPDQQWGCHAQHRQAETGLITPLHLISECHRFEEGP
jgi:hypothetical protein